MSVSQALISQEAHNFKANNNLTQSGEGQSLLLQLPFEIIQLLGKFSSTGNTSKEAAENAVLFGKVSALTHLITHNTDEINAVISLQPAIEEVLDYARNRAVIPEDMGNPNSIVEEYIIRDKQISLSKITYNIFKRTIEPLNTQNAAAFISRSIDFVNEIKWQCSLNKSGLDYTQQNAEQILKKRNPILYTLCEEIINDVFLIHGNDMIAKDIFEKKVHEITEAFKGVTDIFGRSLLDKYSFSFAFTRGLSEVLIISSLGLKTKIIEQEVQALECELQVLRGPNHFDGEINEMFQQMVSAKANGETEKAISLGKSYDQLMVRLREIAVFDDSGTIVGGKLGELYTKLKDPSSNVKEDAETQEQRIQIFKQFIKFLSSPDTRTV